MTCSCTADSIYWFSTTPTAVPDSVWFVFFYDGGVYGSWKNGNGAYYVRAVRGGSPSSAFLDVTTGVLD